LAQGRENREKGKENSEIKAGKRQRNNKGDRGKKVGTGASKCEPRMKRSGRCSERGKYETKRGRRVIGAIKSKVRLSKKR